MKPHLAFLLLTLWLGGFFPTAAQGQPLLYTVPFRAGDGGYVIYRIPALWWMPKSPLLAFAEARASGRRMAGDIDIALRRSFDHGQTWEPMQIVVDLDKDACGNPCVVRDESTGRIWLAFTRSRGQDTEEQIVAGTVPGTRVYVIHSDDQGATWSDPREISETAREPDWGWYGTGPGLGLYLRRNQGDGRLLIPAYHSEGGIYRTHCLYSDDHGETWQRGAVAAEHSSEPQIAELDQRTLLMNARTIAGHGQTRTLAVSSDRGETWKPADGLAALPENECQGAFYRCFRSGSDGQYDWVFTHPASRGRVGVHGWISEDGGKTWPKAQLLWSGPSAYTAMIRTEGGLIGMLMECGSKDVYEQIVFVKFAPEWLKARKAPVGASK
ncbi:MAG: exo-alpha-sialidase [Verrucomicrobiales bacterium]|nr:exo-alpha-sialidase [Verrucomicrobiales bacterium]